MDFERALVLARTILDATDCTPEEAAANPAIPEKYRSEVEMALRREQTFELTPVTTIAGDNSDNRKWLQQKDRNDWYYWPRLRQYLLSKKKWPLSRVRSLDQASDEVLRHLSPPERESFNVRGLVLGYVQSGKTANYTSLIAKAADVGYKLFIVLSGMDNGLRKQTQIRLEREIIGRREDPNALKLSAPGKQWHIFTTSDIHGDFDSGNANTASLQGQAPVLMVVKKNGAVLRRVIQWISRAEVQTLRQLPVLVIDDEADQASIDTAGSYITENEQQSVGYEPPSTINGLIRRLLSKFTRCSFVAYTATPYANILIPADQYTPGIGDDLYPRDFFIDLPKPDGYFGPEKLFGKTGLTGEEGGERGIDVFRSIPREDVEQLMKTSPEVPLSLQNAILDYALAGAARTMRNKTKETPEELPSAMLVHTSRLVTEHSIIKRIVEETLQEIRDEWRYQRNEKGDGIKSTLKERWDREFIPVIRDVNRSMEISFTELESFLGPFLESIQIKTLNSEADDTLDYEEQPDANTIVIGGNKLSRGLTIEGLLISYFTRQAQIPMYDTVMQMGRWFGFREDYVDLTRLYMTDELADMFSHLALVEHRLREDIAIYSTRTGITPRDFGMRILAHPSRQVTNRAKQRFAHEIRISYSGTLFQTFRFPLDDLEELARNTEKTLEATKELLSSLHTPRQSKNHLIWENVEHEKITDFLGKVENREHMNELQPIIRYIKKRAGNGELGKWTLAISHLQNRDDLLEAADWGINVDINQISRTRLVKKTNSLGVITDPKDENIGLSRNRIERAYQQLIATQTKPVSQNSTIVKRLARSPDEGLLILYPISKYSAPTRSSSRNRMHLYENPDDRYARNLIGISIPFPVSRSSESETYVQGTPGWIQDDE